MAAHPLFKLYISLLIQTSSQFCRLILWIVCSTHEPCGIQLVAIKWTAMINFSIPN